MTINELLEIKGISRYTLSKTSGVAWATLSDICSGKTKIARCSAITLSKLSTALEISIEELMKFEQVDNINPLEKGLPTSLKKVIDEYVQGEKDDVSYLDCLWGELYGSINADFHSGIITEKQANFLRNKYLF